MKKIYAKFKSKCTETGTFIKKGEEMYYNYDTKKAYSMESEKVKEYEKNEKECNDTRDYIEAQENAYCDNRYNQF